ncbi:MAG: phosphoribosyltransferase family protein [Pseudomonadota bacterium]
MSFRNRAEAAHKLAERLNVYKGKNPLVLAIPRGAVPMARVIADALGGELDVVLVRKLGAPMNPELAVGSVDESGWAYVADYAASAGADAAYIEKEKQRQLEVMRQRRVQYTAARPSIDPAGRIVIVVDDGLATGATMISALHALRARKPARLIAAVPVAPPDTLHKVEKLADETVCLDVPEYFMAVGQFYAEFPQVEDEEVIALLRAAPRAQHPK